MAETFALCVTSGIAPADFWALTPFQTKSIIDRINKNEHDQARKNVYQAWHTAYFFRIERMPPLQDWLKKMQDDENPLSEMDKRQAKVMELRSFFRGQQSKHAKKE